jgi:acetate kinase
VSGSTAAGRCVLVLNCGSSSVKFALVDPQSGRRPLTALADRVGSADPVVQVTRDGAKQTSVPADGSHAGMVAHLLAALSDEERAGIVGVGHRVVHGGRSFAASIRIDEAVLAELRTLLDLAPLHMPANLEGIAATSAALPELGQVAVFDTAFHQTMPPVAYHYAVPTEWYEKYDVRRYGFHGTSHRYVSARAAELLGRPLDTLRLITLHLGNGCSAAAVRHGRSVDTTMGLTPLEGLVMGTRSGDLDPGILGYLADRLGYDLPALLDLLNTRSGMLGLSGLSNDLRTIEDAAEQGHERAQLALDVFCYRVAKAIGGFAVTLGGFDALVFTGGIGERSPIVRSGVLARLGLFGLHEDLAANADNGRGTEGRVSLPADIEAIVVPTDEELLIARDTVELTR